MHALNALQADKPGLRVYTHDPASKGGRTMGRIHKISGKRHWLVLRKEKKRPYYAFRH